jgi:hypothetical protein
MYANENNMKKIIPIKQRNVGVSIRNLPKVNRNLYQVPLQVQRLKREFRQLRLKLKYQQKTSRVRRINHPSRTGRLKRRKRKRKRSQRRRRGKEERVRQSRNECSEIGWIVEEPATFGKVIVFIQVL